MPAEIKFLLKLLLFLLPLLLILGFPLWVLLHSGELMSDDAMVTQEISNPNTLIGLAFSNPVYYMQLHATLQKKPELLVMGSSRVQQIRANFFVPSSSVYIAAGSAQKISYFRHFLEKIPADQSPKILILGLDQKFFNPAYDSGAPDNIDDLLTKPVPATDVLANWSTVYRDYAQGKFTITELLDAPSSSIGLSAMAVGGGYRNDGSHAPGTFATPPADPTFADIDQGIEGFEPSETVSQNALTELDTLLVECQARGIYVIGFVPPFSPNAYGKIQSLPEQFGYLSMIAPDAGAVFKKYGFGFYDFTNPATLGLTTTDMQDGIHLTEQGSAILISKIAASNAELAQFKTGNK